MNLAIVAGDRGPQNAIVTILQSWWIAADKFRYQSSPAESRNSGNQAEEVRISVVSEVNVLTGFGSIQASEGELLACACPSSQSSIVVYLVVLGPFDCEIRTLFFRNIQRGNHS